MTDQEREAAENILKKHGANWQNVSPAASIETLKTHFEKQALLKAMDEYSTFVRDRMQAEIDQLKQALDMAEAWSSNLLNELTRTKQILEAADRYIEHLTLKSDERPDDLVYYANGCKLHSEYKKLKQENV